MSNTSKKIIRRIIAFSLAVVLGVVCLPSRFTKIANARVVTPDGGGNCWLTGEMSDVWNILTSGSFTITVNTQNYHDSAENMGFLIELYEGDDSFQIESTWSLEYALYAGENTVVIDQNEYFKHMEGDWGEVISDSEHLNLTSGRYWGKVTSTGCEVESVVIAAGETYTTHYIEITNDLKSCYYDHNDFALLTVEYRGDSPNDYSWMGIKYYDTVNNDDIWYKSFQGKKTGVGTVNLFLTKSDLETMSVASYIEVYGAECEGGYQAYLKSVDVTPINSNELYTQKTPVENGKYSQRWVELVPESSAENYTQGSLTITRENDNKTMTVSLTSCYNSVSAAGAKLEAPDGYVFVAYALTGIPDDVTLSASEIVFTEE